MIEKGEMLCSSIINTDHGMLKVIEIFERKAQFFPERIG